METKRGPAFLGEFHALFRVGTSLDLTDGQLLERYSTRRDEAGEVAFAALVERHGPMVLRVCRSVLADPHDAHDAFQATFLVLVRKARALWVRDSLGPWLHQVAYRTACCARTASARRQRHERRAALLEPEGRMPRDDEPVRLLHEEIERLPERHRAPVVLCDLQGCTHEQAARHLGWPVGTVKSRLSRARERLRDRLARRGLAPGATLAAALPKGDCSGVLVPPALASSAVRAAAEFVTTRTMVRGSAAILAQGVLRAMMTTRGLKAASLLLALGATVSGAGLLARGAPGDEPRPQESPKAERADATPVAEVKPGKLRVGLVQRGSLESAEDRGVYNEVKIPTTIISLVPEGTRVKKGDLVCELDSAALRDRLIVQWAATRKARAESDQARRELEGAELDVGAFERVAAPLQEAAIEGRIQVAEAELELARRRAEKVEHKAEADEVAKAEARLAVRRAGQALEQAKGELRLFREYTKEKELLRLRAQAAKANARFLPLEDASRLEMSKEEDLKRQIGKCKLLAPADGLVVYAVEPPSIGGFNAIEQNATVRERQKVFSIFDPDGPVRVNTKVREAVVDQLKPGMQTSIKVDAFPGRVLTGKVTNIFPIPDPGRLTAPNAPKVYTTHVKLDEGLPGLRPGMTAEVDILIKELDGVLSVPVQAVKHLNGKDQVAVRRPDGGFEWREVALGASDGKVVEIKQGIATGESVALDAASLRSEDGKRDKAVGKSPGPSRGVAKTPL